MTVTKSEERAIPPTDTEALFREARQRRRRRRIGLVFIIVLAAAGIGIGFAVANGGTPPATTSPRGSHAPVPISASEQSACKTLVVQSASMEPTIKIGQTISVHRNAYRTLPPARGDIVVFPIPQDQTTASGVDLVKRVIGLPGETISSVYGEVWIDGRPLNEPWLAKSTVTTGLQTQRIPPDEYFVLGDNRGDSDDSRVFGPISRSLIVGKASLVACGK
jgi:signal peptidase I